MWYAYCFDCIMFGFRWLRNDQHLVEQEASDVVREEPMNLHCFMCLKDVENPPVFSFSMRDLVAHVAGPVLGLNAIQTDNHGSDYKERKAALDRFMVDYIAVKQTSSRD